MGRHDEAITQVTRAQQLDPLDDVINANAVGFRTAAGRFAEAIQEAKQALELNPDFRHVRDRLV
jgi:tetratricopeptide (TPR) repeat protein